MRELILAALSLVLQTGVCFCMGSLLMRFLKMKADAVQALIFGYLLYFALFELLAVPMTLLLAPLSLLRNVWGCFLAVVVLAAIWLEGKSWFSRLRTIPAVLKSHSFWLLVLIAAIGIQCLYAVTDTLNSYDATYYVGTVSTSVYTNTLGRFNPYNGLPNKTFSARYIFASYPMHNAFWCQLLGIPALIQTKLVMVVLNVSCANLIFYQIGRRLFGGEKKQADLMVLLAGILQLFSCTIYTSGAFLFTRAYEGKALLANVSIPLVLFVAIWFWQEQKGNAQWVILFLTSLSAVAFSGSAIIFPAALGAGILPVIVMKKAYRKLGPFLVCMTPPLLYAAVYFASSVGILRFPAV